VRIPVIDTDRPPAAAFAGATAIAPHSGAPPAAPSAAASAPFAGEFRGAWTVAPGDTLWAIARRHGITPELLATANGRSLDDPLKPGDTLKVPAEEP